MLWHDVQTEDLAFIRRTPNADRQLTDTDPELVNADDPELINVIMMGAFDHNRVASYLDRVPLPPAIYAFTYRQRQKQRFFFEQFLASPIYKLPYSTLDLYQVAMIAVCK
jgi:hypothetical protein